MKQIKSSINEIIFQTNEFLFDKFYTILFHFKIDEKFFIFLANFRYLTRSLMNKKHSLNGKLVVSLTSYPDRYKTLNFTLRTILSQSIKPDKILLWIYKKDLKKIPKNVKELQNKTFKIKTCNKDLKSYKKLLPTLKLYPKAFIITADDDAYYERNWLKKLIGNYRPSLNEVIGHWGVTIKTNSKGKIMPYVTWLREPIKNDIKKVMLIGVGGIFYPPNSLNKEVFNEKVFINKCKTADDIWFYFMSRKNNFKIKAISTKFRTHIWNECKKNNLSQINVFKKGNDISINNLVKYYGKPF